MSRAVPAHDHPSTMGFITDQRTSCNPAPADRAASPAAVTPPRAGEPAPAGDSRRPSRVRPRESLPGPGPAPLHPGRHCERCLALEGIDMRSLATIQASPHGLHVAKSGAHDEVRSTAHLHTQSRSGPSERRNRVGRPGRFCSPRPGAAIFRVPQGRHWRSLGGALPSALSRSKCGVRIQRTR